MKNKKALFLSACVLPLLVACSDTATETAATQQADNKDTAFTAYLELKRIAENDTARVERARQQFDQQEKITAAIAQTDVLDKTLIDAEVNEFRKQMLMNRYFDEFLQQSVSAEKVRNYYANNSDKYQSTQVRAAHILLRVNAQMSETERQAVLTTAQEVHSKLNAGESFNDLALSYSQDKISAERGGELGWLKDGAVDTEFSRQLFELEPGKYSQPFLTAFGFHIVKSLEGPQVVKKPFEAVQGDIRYQLRHEAKQAEIDRLLAVTDSPAEQ